MIHYVNKNSQKNGGFPSKSHKKGTFESWFPHFRLYSVKSSPINTVFSQHGLGFPQKPCYLGNSFSRLVYIVHTKAVVNGFEAVGTGVVRGGGDPNPPTLPTSILVDQLPSGSK